jgi:hypothetical protein
MTFLQVWLSGLINPSRAFDELKSKSATIWGFWAILIRFAVTSLTTTLALYLLGRVPFETSRLTFLTMENYYAAEVFFLPVFGLAVWLLGSAIVHLVLRLARKTSDFDQILNILGMGMLIPMPVIWIWDWTMIALNWYQMTIMAISHSFFALWGVILYSIGFKRILGLRVMVAIGLSLVIAIVYISLAMIFVR